MKQQQSDPNHLQVSQDLTSPLESSYLSSSNLVHNKNSKVGIQENSTPSGALRSEEKDEIASIEGVISGEPDSALVFGSKNNSRQPGVQARRSSTLVFKGGEISETGSSKMVQFSNEPTNMKLNKEFLQRRLSLYDTIKPRGALGIAHIDEPSEEDQSDISNGSPSKPKIERTPENVEETPLATAKRRAMFNRQLTIRMDKSSLLSPMLPHKLTGERLNLRKLERGEPEPLKKPDTKDDLKNLIRDHFDKLQKDLDFDSVGIQGALSKKKKKMDMNRVETIDSEEEEDSKLLEDVSNKSVDGKDPLSLTDKRTFIYSDLEQLKNAILILKKSKDKRTEKELQTVLLPLISELSFFKERLKILTTRDLLEICQNLKYEFVESGETIFDQGNPGDKFYVILKGRVQVSIKEKEREEGILNTLNKKKSIRANVQKALKKKLSLNIASARTKNRRQLEEEARQNKEKVKKVFDTTLHDTKVLLEQLLEQQNRKRTTVSPSQVLTQHVEECQVENLGRKTKDQMEIVISSSDEDPEEEPQRGTTQGDTSNLVIRTRPSSIAIPQNRVSTMSRHTIAMPMSTKNVLITEMAESETGGVKALIEKTSEFISNSEDLMRIQNEDFENEQGLLLLDKLLRDGRAIDPYELLIKASASKLETESKQDDFIINDVAHLGPGCCFGEMSLINNKPRTATIKCLQRCHLVVLSSQDYQSALGEIDRKKLAEKISFMKDLPVFQKLSRTFLSRFSFFFKEMKVTKDALLFQEGDPAKFAFIIKEGEFEITKKVRTTNKTPESENLLSVFMDPTGTKSQSLFQSHSSKFEVKEHKLNNVGAGNMVGDDDIAFRKRQTYTTTVRCLSQQASLLFIEAENFKKLATQPFAWKALYEINKEKCVKMYQGLKQQRNIRRKIQKTMATAAIGAQQNLEALKKIDSSGHKHTVPVSPRKPHPQRQLSFGLDSLSPQAKGRGQQHLLPQVERIGSKLQNYNPLVEEVGMGQLHTQPEAYDSARDSQSPIRVDPDPASLTYRSPEKKVPGVNLDKSTDEVKFGNSFMGSTTQFSDRKGEMGPSFAGASLVKHDSAVTNQRNIPLQISFNNDPDVSKQYPQLSLHSQQHHLKIQNDQFTKTLSNNKLRALPNQWVIQGRNGDSPEQIMANDSAAQTISGHPYKGAFQELLDQRLNKYNRHTQLQKLTMLSSRKEGAMSNNYSPSSLSAIKGRTTMSNFGAQSFRESHSTQPRPQNQFKLRRVNHKLSITGPPQGMLSPLPHASPINTQKAMNSTFNGAPLFGKKRAMPCLNRGSQPDIPKRHLEDLSIPLLKGKREVQSFYLSGSTDISKHINERWQQKQAIEAIHRSEVTSDAPGANYHQSSRCHPAINSGRDPKLIVSSTVDSGNHEHVPTSSILSNYLIAQGRQGKTRPLASLFSSKKVSDAGLYSSRINQPELQMNGSLGSSRMNGYKTAYDSGFMSRR